MHYINIAVINNNYRRLQDLILVFKIPMVTWNDFLKIMDNLGTCLEKGLPSLLYRYHWTV